MLARRRFLHASIAGVSTLLAAPMATALAANRSIEVYKSPLCGCCGAWVAHLRAAGFDVRVRDVDDIDPVKVMNGVPENLQSCHTGLIDGYVIEGHVPAREVARLLKERPRAIGLAVPGMPIGSPGMEQGGRRDPYQVVLFSSSRRWVYANY